MRQSPRVKGFFILVASAVVILVGGMAYRQYQLSQAEEVYRKFRQEEKNVTEIKKVGHDFEKLQEINKDIYGWICVEGTKVDYPVLQGAEDNYYLTHDMNGESSVAGAIYSNLCNSKDMTDGITILYGHDMKADTMFGSLHYFDDTSFFGKHREMTLETRDGMFCYEILGVYNYNDDYLPEMFDVKNQGGVLAFNDALKKCQEAGDEMTHVRKNAQITEADRLLVLSTCIAGQDDRRFLVVGKLSQYVDYE